MTRLYVDSPLAIHDELTLPESAARHVVQVLRMRVGDHVVLFNGHGFECAATLIEVGRRDARVRIESVVEVDRESPLRVLLAQCISKGDRMDYSLQKAVELGVGSIQPLISSRCAVRLDASRWEKKQLHWQGVIVSACEQCGRTRIPELLPVLGLRDWMTQASTGLRMVLSPGGRQGWAAWPRPADGVSLVVGPEGGLDDDELSLADAHGFKRIGLGPRVLRTETAGVVALSVIQAVWGDL